MAIGTAISGIIGSVLGSSSSSGDNNEQQGMAGDSLPSNVLGAAGDPGTFLFNQWRYNQQRDYQKEQNRVKNRLLNLQSEQLEIQNEEARKKQKWNKDFQRLMLGGGR